MSRPVKSFRPTRANAEYLDQMAWGTRGDFINQLIATARKEEEENWYALAVKRGIDVKEGRASEASARDPTTGELLPKAGGVNSIGGETSAGNEAADRGSGGTPKGGRKGSDALENRASDSAKTPGSEDTPGRTGVRLGEPGGFPHPNDSFVKQKNGSGAKAPIPNTDGEDFQEAQEVGPSLNIQSPKQAQTNTDTILPSGDSEDRETGELKPSSKSMKIHDIQRRYLKRLRGDPTG